MQRKGRPGFADRHSSSVPLRFICAPTKVHFAKKAQRTLGAMFAYWIHASSPVPNGPRTKALAKPDAALHMCAHCTFIT